ncbi:MAG: 16S rRNA (cytosine(967)-C(5))-methyltransferase RsmB [Acidiferrobacterales bacterium]
MATIPSLGSGSDEPGVVASLGSMTTALHADGPKARARAARIVAEVVRDGKLLDTALRATLRCVPQSTALIQELAYGTLRWLPQLQVIAAQLLKKPLRAKDTDVGALLLLGLYQLLYMRFPAHAAVSETVAAARALGKPWCAELLNACLRRFLRDKVDMLADIAADPVASTGHPEWLLLALQQAWPDNWRAIVEANNQRPPMTLRVNLSKNTREEYLLRLRDAGLAATPTPATDCGLVLEKPLPVAGLPGFADGCVSIQDAAAQLASDMLDVRPGERVLDACAAPGGKLGHLLERYPAAEVIGVDKEPARLALIQENLTRLDLQGTVVLGDASEPSGWWDGIAFDQILLDAPCSATGVIRRHPDIKCRRTSDQLYERRRTQTALLKGLWPLLVRGGKLLYVTCSVLPEENAQQISAFTACQANAQVVPLRLPFAMPCDSGVQILPGKGGMDGFYYACLQKT